MFQFSKKDVLQKQVKKIHVKKKKKKKETKAQAIHVPFI